MSEDARALYAPPEPQPPASKWCHICDSFGSHFTDRHEDDELASDVEGLAALVEARRRLKGS